MSARLSGLVRVASLVTLSLLVVVSCRPSPKINITSPLHGAFIDAGSVLVEGTTTRYNANWTIEVNGVIATFLPDKSWSATIPLNQVEVINPVDAVLKNGAGQMIHQQRVTYVAGPSVADGAYSPEGVGLRFNNSGLAAIEPLVESLAGGALDITSLILTGGNLIEGATFFTFTIDAWAYEADIGGFSLDVTSQAAGHTDVDVTVDDLHLGIVMNLDDGLAINTNCTLELDVGQTLISGSYDMVPKVGEPTQVDVNQLGDANVTLTDVNYLFISGPCDPDAPLVGDIINAAVGAGGLIEDLMEDGFRDNLKDPDGAGPLDAPIAAGIQDALAGISIAGEVSAAVGVMLDAPFVDISEDADGISMGADASFTSQLGTGPGECDAPALAPDFIESYDIPVTSPGFGALTPGGSPYGLGLAISASAFNQLLKATVECGLLNIELTEIPLIGPITSSTFGLLGIPEFALILGHGVPLTITIKPTIAPFVTDGAGPAGEMAELAIPYLVMEVTEPGNNDKLWLSIAIDTRLGLDLVYQAETAELATVLTAPLPADTLARVISNAIFASTNSVENSIPLVLPLFFQFLGDLFGSFPLPTFLGLQLDVVEIQRDYASGFFNLYTNLNVVPTTRIENAVFIDQSPGDYVTDDVFDVREWRHRHKMTATSTSIDAQLQGVLAVDACCTLGDESASESPKYRVEFDVVPENGESWQLAIDHDFLGALTLVDEANAIYDGSELAAIQTPIRGKYSVDAGPTTNFDFNVGPVTSVFDDFGGAENDHSVEVSGTSGVVLCGSTPAHVDLEFEFTLYVESDSNVAFPAIDGGEAAVRFGVHDTIELGTAPSAGFTAGNYPGLGGREISEDGHFTTVTLTALPGGCP